MRHILIILSLFLFSLTIISCSEKEESSTTPTTSTTSTTPTTSPYLTYTTSDLTTNTTYYWKVIASDTKGGSAESETWSFTVQ